MGASVRPLIVEAGMHSALWRCAVGKLSDVVAAGITVGSSNVIGS